MSKEKTTETIGETSFYLDGWYTISDVEKILAAMKSSNDKARKAMDLAMRESSCTNPNP